ncbi:hypothetical protein NUU61_003203 [Penicillium alfredii]|uniref:Tyrosine specific protein phosphatases domain-containing protein n=1 Tax=Penicillium alfredii TaxID=1506179 RepID=A0A9W9KH92_9EURO|nr:uncharacterized protein NUU61_003203 [Penicillium alfredii]KAJ5105856.1 hypothetical protein NUU61_003203 [Penicillium alfredii]
MKTYIGKYPVSQGDEFDESTLPAFMERHPYLNAAPLPTFDGESGRYIASASPLWRGGGMKTLWWDMIQQQTSDNAVIISLMERNEEPDPDYIRETTDTLIPPNEANPTVAYELEANGDETCNVKYTVSLVSSESPIKNVLEYRQLRLQYRGQSRNLHYIHYPGWANEQGIGNQNMKALIDLVNKKQGGTNPMVVSCLRGKGRTGTFIEARETWNLAMAAAKKHKNWLAEQKQSPFLTYTKAMRKIRSGMVDSSSQYRFLKSWAQFVWDEVQKILDEN